MPHDLDRYLVAQEQEKDGFRDAIEQLRLGRKTGHWIWWIFPQIEGLGETETTRHYAIVSLDEARAYLAHPTLGARLLECARALLATEGLTGEEILGPTDTKKLRSSMTLLMRADPEEPLFGQVLARFYDGRADERTDALLRDVAPSIVEPAGP